MARESRLTQQACFWRRFIFVLILVFPGCFWLVLLFLACAFVYSCLALTGMLLAPNGRWYWYGESKKLDESKDKNKYKTQGVNCYSSTTIAGPWRNEGQVLTQDDINIPGFHGPWVVQRPKVIFNNRTKKFVLYFHLDQPKHKQTHGLGGYKFRRVGVATADLPAGPFTFIRGFQPDGIPSLDMNLFRDPLDGQAYVFFGSFFLPSAWP